MSRIATVALPVPAPGLFSRLFARLDRWLLAYAEMSIRSGDIPRYGL